MAKQTSPFPFTGRMAGLSFYRTAAGQDIVRRAAGPSARRLRKDPAYARTRACMSEFGRASSAGAALRRALHLVLPARGDAHARLNQALLRCIRADAVSPYGQRSFTQAGMAGLQGFEWAEALPAGAGLRAAVSVAGGTLSATVPAGAPALWEGGVLTLSVVALQDGNPVRAAAVHDRVALLPAPGIPVTLSCALPSAGVWIATLAICGAGGGGMVVL